MRQGNQWYETKKKKFSFMIQVLFIIRSQKYWFKKLYVLVQINIHIFSQRNIIFIAKYLLLFGEIKIKRQREVGFWKHASPFGGIKKNTVATFRFYVKEKVLLCASKRAPKSVIKIPKGNKTNNVVNALYLLLYSIVCHRQFSLRN